MLGGNSQIPVKAGSRRRWPSIVRPSRILRPLFRSNGFQKAASWIVSSYLRLVFRTSSWTIVGREECGARLARGEKFFVVLWHERIAMMPLAWDQMPTPLTILTSNHPDGRFVSDVMKRFGIGTIGVSSKGDNLRAGMHVMKAFSDGSCIGITPDGPRGPALKFSSASIMLAQKCKTRVSFVTYSVRRRIVMRSWDRFIVPLPFNKGVFMWNEGFDVPEDLDKDGIRALQMKLEQALIDFTSEGDRMVNAKAQR